jgi:hypothetical protein
MPVSLYTQRPLPPQPTKPDVAGQIKRHAEKAAKALKGTAQQARNAIQADVKKAAATFKGLTQGFHKVTVAPVSTPAPQAANSETVRLAKSLTPENLGELLTSEQGAIVLNALAESKEGQAVLGKLPRSEAILNRILENEILNKDFKAHANKEFSLENVEFLEAIKNAKTLEDFQSIYTTFIVYPAEKQVNIDYKQVKDIEKALQNNNPPKNLFNDASIEIKRLVINDTLARYFTDKTKA